MEKIAREQAEPRTDTLVWGKNAVTELLKSGGAVDTVYLADSLPQPVAGYYTALAKQTGAVGKRVPGHKLQKICGTDDHQGVAARAAEVQYASLEDLFAAAEAAAAGGFDSFTSSLFISPYQQHELLREVAERAADEFHVRFLYRDFRPLFRAGQERARELGLYMQKYCGCVFSEEERYLKPSKRIP